MEDPRTPAQPAAAPGNQQVRQVQQTIAKQVAELKQQIGLIQQQSLKTMLDTIDSVFSAPVGSAGIPAPSPSMPHPEPQPPQPPVPVDPSMQQVNDAVNAAIDQANQEMEQAIDQASQEMQQALDMLDGLEVPSGP